MSIPELAVQIKNQPGQLVRITSVLASAQVNVKGLAASSAGKTGWVRLAVDNPDRASEALTSAGLEPELAEAVAVQLTDEPGFLDKALRVLADAKISVDYIFTCVPCDRDRVIVVIGVQTPSKAEAILNGAGIVTLNSLD